MKVKCAYYIPQLPTKIAITLLDGRTLITNIGPWRAIKEEELEPLFGIESGVMKPENFDEFMPFVYTFYGLEKVA